MAETRTPSEDFILYDFDPRNLPSDYLQAIGLLVAASSQTESCMQDLIGSLLGIDNMESLALTSRMTIPLKEHVIKALIELNAAYSYVVDDLDDLMDKVHTAFTRRNIIVHNSFAIHPDTREILSARIKVSGSLQAELQPISVEEIQENAIAIYELGMDIVRFMTRCGIEPRNRTRPIHLPMDRSKKARAKRREVASGENG